MPETEEKITDKRCKCNRKPRNLFLKLLIFFAVSVVVIFKKTDKILFFFEI